MPGSSHGAIGKHNRIGRYPAQRQRLALKACPAGVEDGSGTICVPPIVFCAGAVIASSARANFDTLLVQATNARTNTIRFVDIVERPLCSGSTVTLC